MAYVVCDPCHDCKYTDCVVVCPCECFYEDEKQLYIDPVECIDCHACVSQCPVEAIFHENQVPRQWADFVPLNAERVLAIQQSAGPLTEQKSPLEGPDCKAIA